MGSVSRLTITATIGLRWLLLSREKGAARRRVRMSQLRTPLTIYIATYIAFICRFAIFTSCRYGWTWQLLPSSCFSSSLWCRATGWILCVLASVLLVLFFLPRARCTWLTCFSTYSFQFLFLNVMVPACSSLLPNSIQQGLRKYLGRAK
jgi:hypothetical protein